MSEQPPKPPTAAAALSYRRDSDPAPRITATGKGPVAERILDLAREHGIPLREDPDLVGVLAALDIGAEIPPELYVVIAEVLAWAYRTNAEYAARPDPAEARATVVGWRAAPSPPAT